MRILVRATNWVGDAVMSLPALQVLRRVHPEAHIAVLARPWVAHLYSHEPFTDEVIPYEPHPGWKDLTRKWRMARFLREQKFDMAILLPNSFESALVAALASIPERIGYARDARGWLLTRAIKAPHRDEIPRHEQFYYLELLRRAGIIDELPRSDTIRLTGATEAAHRGASRFRELGLEEPVIGMSPGAAFGTAKRWLPERFAETASKLEGTVALFGSAGERPLCEHIASLIPSHRRAHNFAGETTLREFIDLAAACRLYITNDSGGMHIASALGVPTVAIFGATDHLGTGPTGPLARIVREPVECSPCKLRECPIDHRCMTRVDVDRVVQVSRELI